ncbi:MAG: rhamnogalacturonan acetylesterase [Polyangiales bacterium]
MVKNELKGRASCAPFVLCLALFGACAAEPGEGEHPDHPYDDDPVAERAGEADDDEPAAQVSTPALAPLTVYLAGDSTVMTYADTRSDRDQAGWGQMLAPLFTSTVKVTNRAEGGRTARRFIDEGRLDAILKTLKKGDYLLVQFGTNDGHKTATYVINGKTIPYYADPQTDFKKYLKPYVDGARKVGAIPVFVTPPPRNSAYCTGGNGTGAHAEAMRELGKALEVPVVDLNARTVAHLKAICPAPKPETVFMIKPDGTIDGTHFQERGAKLLAGLVVDELRKLELPLAGALK